MLKVGEASVETMCVINAAIVFFVIAAHQGERGALLQQIVQAAREADRAEREADLPEAENGPPAWPAVFEGFLKLLAFWGEVYCSHAQPEPEPEPEPENEPAPAPAPKPEPEPQPQPGLLQPRLRAALPRVLIGHPVRALAARGGRPQRRPAAGHRSLRPKPLPPGQAGMGPHVHYTRRFRHGCLRDSSAHPACTDQWNCV